MVQLPPLFQIPLQVLLQVPLQAPIQLLVLPPLTTSFTLWGTGAVAVIIHAGYLYINRKPTLTKQEQSPPPPKKNAAFFKMQ